MLPVLFNTCWSHAEFTLLLQEFYEFCHKLTVRRCRLQRIRWCRLQLTRRCRLQLTVADVDCSGCDCTAWTLATKLPCSILLLAAIYLSLQFFKSVQNRLFIPDNRKRLESENHEVGPASSALDLFALHGLHGTWQIRLQWLGLD